MDSVFSLSDDSSVLPDRDDVNVRDAKLVPVRRLIPPDRDRELREGEIEDENVPV